MIMFLHLVCLSSQTYYIKIELKNEMFADIEYYML